MNKRQISVFILLHFTVLYKGLVYLLYITLAIFFFLVRKFTKQSRFQSIYYMYALFVNTLLRPIYCSLCATDHLSNVIYLFYSLTGDIMDTNNNVKR